MVRYNNDKGRNEEGRLGDRSNDDRRGFGVYYCRGQKNSMGRLKQLTHDHSIKQLRGCGRTRTGSREREDGKNRV